MKLTDQQKQALAGWVAAGESLSNIQKRLESEFGLRMTYMDLRFLVDDLDLDLGAGEPEPEADDAADASADTPAEPAEAELVGGSGDGRVTVEVDKVMRPGAVVSGSVTFSDGESMGWQLDQMGQLGLLPGSTEGYRPGEQDIQAFQQALQAELQKQGF